MTTGNGTTWDPGEYLRYADERARAFHDLIARVGADSPAYVVDLGCGPGNATATLLDRWPSATVTGIDSSPEMIASARALQARMRDFAAGDAGTGDAGTGDAGTGDAGVGGAGVGGAGVGEAPVRDADRLSFQVGDLRTWEPDRPVDVLVSNATLQWIGGGGRGARDFGPGRPGHLELLPRLVNLVAPGGWFAFQVPGNFDAPSHRLLHELASEPPWAELLAGQDIDEPAGYDPGDYLDVLAGTGCEVDAWETTYLLVLGGDDPVLSWMKGTGARPILQALPDPGTVRAFEAAYRERLRDAYPRRPYGTVLPYRRVFAVAHRTTS